MKRLASLFLLLAVAGCPDIDTDANETTSTVVEFDPANRIIPFPNNLLLDPANGKVKLPAQCGESPTAKALREGVLNQLDGFGTYESALTVTFTEAVDVASLADKIVIYKRGADVSTATSLPVVTLPSMTQRFDANCENPKVIPQLIIVPGVPLEQKSVYVVALRKGIKATGGQEFSPSLTWAIMRSKEDPVTVENGVIVADRTPLNPADPEDAARLLGIDQLWNVFAGMLKFVAEELPEGKRLAREEILLAWEFKTQTTTDPLDPAVAGSPAASVLRGGLEDVISIIGGGTAEQFLVNVTPDRTCDLYPCSEVGDVQRGKLNANRYQPRLPNPLAGSCEAPDFLGCAIAGQWSDPANPTLQGNPDRLDVFIVTPKVACPAEGCPTIIFGHGLGQSKGNALVIGARFAEQGFATVAIDAVAHGSRRARLSNTGACANFNDPKNPGDTRPPNPTCHAPFLSPNLGATRDNIRQTVLDNHSLVAALKVCNGTPCGGFKPDLAKLFYVGQSLGGILGTTTAATIPDLKASVLNVPAVGWVDILENTKTDGIKCPLVDGLIAAGILVGEKSNFPATPTTGLCAGDEWKTQPGYRQFSSIGRWVLDAADPANFARKLATRRFLIQQVVDDQVVPNIATEREAALLGQAAAAAAEPGATAPPALPPPSAVIATSKWVTYKNLDPAAPSFPGNTFAHGSLLSPAPPPRSAPGTPAGADGILATLRMQSDAIDFIKRTP